MHRPKSDGKADGEKAGVHELVRTNNAVLITAIEALLNGAGIRHLVLDQNMSVLEGSLGILPRRILVDDEELHAARRVLEDAGLAMSCGRCRPGKRRNLPTMRYWAAGCG